jgi:mannose-6-phosphate isomerase-like protein (cupin superfamily)
LFSSSETEKEPMKYLAGFTALLTSVFFLSVVTGQAPATFVDHNTVAEAVGKGGVLTSGSDFRVQGGHRTTPSEVEVHDKETDIIYVTDGEATYVTGGTMIGGKVTAPGQLRGTSIQGGETHQLTKGDVIVIPAGTPHWTRDVRTSVSFYIVKVLKP